MSDVRRIAGYPAVRTTFEIGARALTLYTVDDLEALVDRQALLRGEAEPPYWAHLWSGARVLASYLARCVDLPGRRVLEIGCGLGLPGLTAAAGGADVTFVDDQSAALQFVTASAEINGWRCTTVQADLASLDPSWRFDLVLGAEVAYDPGRFAALAAVFARHVGPNGSGLLADGYRTDTRGVYRELDRLGLTTHAMDVRVDEEGRAAPVRVTRISRRDSRQPPL